MFSRNNFKSTWMGLFSSLRYLSSEIVSKKYFSSEIDSVIPWRILPGRWLSEISKGPILISRVIVPKKSRKNFSWGVLRSFSRDCSRNFTRAAFRKFSDFFSSQTTQTSRNSFRFFFQRFLQDCFLAIIYRFSSELLGKVLWAFLQDFFQHSLRRSFRNFFIIFFLKILSGVSKAIILFFFRDFHWNFSQKFIPEFSHGTSSKISFRSSFRHSYWSFSENSSRIYF